MTKRIVVDDAKKKSAREREQALREKLKGKDAAKLSQAELAELVLLLAMKAGLLEG